MPFPFVNILLSTYNGSDFIEKQIESLQSQINVNISITIRDDGSDKQHLNLLKNIAQKHSNIELDLSHNIGLPGSFFQLMKNQSNKQYDYYAFCDQDDIWLPDKLTSAIQQLKAIHSPIALYCSRQIYIDKNDKKIGSSFRPPKNISLKNAIFENLAVGCTCVFTSSLLQQALQTKDYRNIVMHDWWVYLIASSIGEVTFDTTPHIYYRQHSNNAVGGKLSHWRKLLSRIEKYINIQLTNKGGPIDQLEAFYNEFSTQISSEDADLIKKVLVNYDRSIIQRIRIASNSLFFYRQTFSDHITWKLLYLFKML